MSIGSISNYEFLLMGNSRRRIPPVTPFIPTIIKGSISNYEFMMMNRRRRQAVTPFVVLPTQTPSTIRDVFAAWRQILVDTGCFVPESNVIISGDDDEFPQSGTAYCLLFPLDFVPDNGSVNGGGRFCTIVDGQFSVIVRTRNRKNLAYQDSYLVNDAGSTGVLWLADCVMNSLHMSTPVDSFGNELTAEPTRFNRYMKVSRAGTQSEWSGVRLIFDCSLQYRFPTNTGN